MSHALQQAIQRAKDDEYFLAKQLANAWAYHPSPEGFARWLGVEVADLPRLSLCRCPASDADLAHLLATP